jgi:ion channel-forming bestrophin family protein
MAIYVLPHQPAASFLLIRYLVLLPWSLKARVRNEPVSAQNDVLRALFPPDRFQDDYAWLVNQHQTNPPVAVVGRIRHIIATVFDTTGTLSTSRQDLASHSNTAVAASDSKYLYSPVTFFEPRTHELELTLGVIDRLFSSPIPPTYSRHLSRVLVLQFVFMPISLVAAMPLASVMGIALATMIAAYVFMGIDEVGIEIERVFTLMPLQQLCASLQKTVRGQVSP